MKILRIVYDWPPPWEQLAPGPYYLSEQQAKLGNRVTVFCGGWPRKKKAVPHAVQIYRLPSGCIPGLNLSVFFSTAPAALLYYLIYRLFRHVDVIHIHGHLSLFINLYKHLFGWLDKTPYVLHLHNTAAARADKAKNPTFLTRIEWSFHKFADRTGVQTANKIICVSDSLKQEVLQYYQADPAKIEVINNGVNTDSFEPIGLKNDLFPGRKTLIFVGSLSKRKNPTLIIQALKHLDTNYTAVFIGSGNQENNLKQLVQKLDLDDRVKIIGYVPNQKLPSYLRGADLLVLPSSYEAFPKVALEALACGIPALSSGFDPGSEFKNMIFPISELSAKSLALNIQSVFDKYPHINHNLIRKNYCWETVAKKIQNVYEKIRT
ncbi:glycosyltransferase family 4 protein [Patescibacteria group bacterium]|nr:glycosyltransferase family 4 protein [Patescibacteria group bacterium]